MVARNAMQASAADEESAPQRGEPTAPRGSPRCFSREVLARTYWLLRTASGKVHAMVRGSERCVCGMALCDDWTRLPASTPLVQTSCPVCLRMLVSDAAQQDKFVKARARESAQRRAMRKQDRPAWCLPIPECMRYAKCWREACADGATRVNCTACTRYAALVLK